jgi:hypothetical protein
MSSWKLASSVFFGGTGQIQAIKGRRVRARVPLSNFNVYDPINPRTETFSVRAGAIGLIANPHPNRPELLIAFPLNPALAPTTLDNLMRTGGFKVVMVNEPTFRLQFEIEA